MNELEDIAAHVFHLDDLNDSSANESCPEMKKFRTESIGSTESFFSLTQDGALMHALTSSKTRPSQRYNDNLFYRLLINTGFSRASSGTLKQYQVYFRLVGRSEFINKGHELNCRVSTSVRTSEGTAASSVPFHEASFKITMHIVRGRTASAVACRYGSSRHFLQEHGRKTIPRRKWRFKDSNLFP